MSDQPISIEGRSDEVVKELLERLAARHKDFKSLMIVGETKESGIFIEISAGIRKSKMAWMCMALWHYVMDVCFGSDS